MAYERVTLYGVPLVADRLVSYGRVDRGAEPASCSSGTPWCTASGTPGTGSCAENQRLLEEAEELEHRARRRDIVVDEHTLFDFYDARVGAEVVSGAHFDTWWKQERRQRPDLLTFDPAMLTHETADEVRADDFPETVAAGRGPDVPDQLPLRAGRRRRRAHHRRAGRHPQPGRRRRLLLERARPARGAGHQPDPQPAQEPAGQLRAGAQQGPRVPGRRAAGGGAAARRPRALAARSTTGVVVPREAWDWSQGRRRTCGRPTGSSTTPAPSRRAARTSRRSRRRCGRQFDAGAWPRSPPTAGSRATGADRRGPSAPIEESFTQTRAGHEVRGLPGARRRGRRPSGSRVFGSADEAGGPAPARRTPAAAAGHAVAGRRRSLDGPRQRPEARAGRVAVPLRRRAARRLPRPRSSATSSTRDPPVRDAARRTTRWWRPARDGPARRTCAPVLADVLARARPTGATPTRRSAAAPSWRTLPALHGHAGAARPGWSHRGFVGEAGADRLRRFPTYLAARRVAAASGSTAQVARDRQLMDQVADLQEACLHQVEALPEGRPPGAALRQVRWMLEEYRVSLWAQQLGTGVPRQRPADPQGSWRRPGCPRRRACDYRGAMSQPPPPPARRRRATGSSRRIEAGGDDPALVARGRRPRRRRCWCAAPATPTTPRSPSGCSTSPTPRASRRSPRSGPARPADSLAGCLWRLYLLRSWVYADPVAVAREFEAGRARAQVGAASSPASPTRPAPTS